MSRLDAALRAAHARDDRAALIALYTQAAEAAAREDARAFFLTQAYVHALEIGAAEAAALRDRLAAMGRI